MTETVLCVDIGTTSLKAGLISAAGEVVSFSSNKFGNPEDRFIAGFWGRSLKTALLEIQKNIKDADIKISAISISGNGPTVVSMSEMTVRWNEQIDLSNFGINKADLGHSLFLPKILLFKSLFSKEFEQSQYIFSGPEYLIYKLTSQAVTVLPEKRFEAAYWNQAQLLSFGIEPSKLPPFVGIGEVCGYLTGEMADFFKLPAGIPVTSGGPDFVAALIGTKTLQPGRIVDRCGSSEGFNYCIPEFIVADGVRSLPSAIEGLWNASVLLPNSSKLSEKERLDFAKNAVQTLKGLSQKYKIDFPNQIIVTGGQAKDWQLMQDKARALGIKLVACQCSDAERLGDACAAFVALGQYAGLQEAAEKIVREETTYDYL